MTARVLFTFTSVARRDECSVTDWVCCPSTCCGWCAVSWMGSPKRVWVWVRVSVLVLALVLVQEWGRVLRTLV